MNHSSKATSGVPGDQELALEKAPAKYAHSIWDKKQSLILFGLSVAVIFVLVGLWWVQQNNVNAFQKQIDLLKEKDKLGKLTPQQSLELQKNIAGLEKDRITLINNVYGTLVQATGGAVLLIGLYFTWRNYKTTEETAANNLKSAQETLRLSQEGQVTERFTRAIDQIGNEKIEVQLGGIYALERITKDSPKDHRTIMEVLTSFVQEKSPLPEKVNEQQEGPTTQEQQPPKITRTVQAALTVIGRHDSNKEDPEDKRLDLSSANLSGANLIRASLSDVYLSDAHLSDADLSRANLIRANLIRANLRGTNLSKASLWGGILSDADLSRASLVGADLSKAMLWGASLIEAGLKGANLRGASFWEGKGLTSRQVQFANNWQQATFDIDFYKELGLLSEPDQEDS